jgi:hypothetical protein
VATKKKCKAKASASGDQCKRNAVKDGYCKQHYNQTHPQVDEEEVRASLDVVEADAPQATYQVDLVQANPEFQRFEIAKRIAHTLAQSNLVPDAYRGRPNDCFVAINMGWRSTWERSWGWNRFRPSRASLSSTESPACMVMD